MYLTPAQAAKATGKSRSVISRAIKAEKLPAKKDEKGQWQITPENLLQVLPEASLESRPEQLSEISHPAGDSRLNALRRKFSGLVNSYANKQSRSKRTIENGYAC